MDEGNSTSNAGCNDSKQHDNLAIHDRKPTLETDTVHNETAGTANLTPNTHFAISHDSRSSRSSDSDADIGRHIENNTTLPSEWFSSLSMPKNWYQVERLKEQRRILQQNLPKKTISYSESDDSGNTMAENEVKIEDISLNNLNEDICEPRSVNVDHMNEYTCKASSFSEYSQDDSSSTFPETVVDCELRSLSAEELNTYLTDAASLSTEFQDAGKISENEDEIDSNDICNNSSDMKYTESTCLWKYGCSKTKCRCYAIPNTYKFENNIHDSTVPHMLDESRSQTTIISQFKPLNGTQNDKSHISEYGNIDKMSANNILCHTNDSNMSSKSIEVSGVLSPITSKGEGTPKIDYVKCDETDVCEFKDIEFLRNKVEEVQEGVVENLEKVVENITGNTVKKYVKDTKYAANAQSNDADNDKRLYEVSEPVLESDQKLNINFNNPITERNNEVIQQMELYELRKKINEQKIKILGMQIKQLDLLKTNTESKINVQSIKKEIANKSLEINEKQLQLMHDNSEIMHMLGIVKENCNPHSVLESRSKKTNKKTNPRKRNSCKKKSIIKSINRFNDIPIMSQICTNTNTTDTKVISNANSKRANNGIVQSELQINDTTLVASTACTEDIAHTVNTSTSKPSCTSVNVDIPISFSPSSQLLHNLKPATIAALNVAKIASMNTVQKIETLDIPEEVTITNVNKLSVPNNITKQSEIQVLISRPNSQNTHTSNTICTLTNSTSPAQSQSLRDSQTRNSETIVFTNGNHTSENSNNNNEHTVKRTQMKQLGTRRILPKTETQNSMQQIIQRDPHGRFTTSNASSSLPMVHYRVSRQVRLCNQTSESRPRIFGAQSLLPPPVIYMDKFGNIVYGSSYKHGAVSANIVNVPVQTQFPVATSTFVTQTRTPFSNVAHNNGNQIAVTAKAASSLPISQEAAGIIPCSLAEDVQVCSILPRSLTHDIKCSEIPPKMPPINQDSQNCQSKSHNIQKDAIINETTPNTIQCERSDNESEISPVQSTPTTTIPSVLTYKYRIHNAKNISPTQETLKHGSDQSKRKRNASTNDGNEDMESADMMLKTKQRKYNVDSHTLNKSQLITEKCQTFSSCEKETQYKSSENANNVVPNTNTGIQDNVYKVNKKKRKKSAKRRLISPLPFLDFPARIVQNTAKIIVSPPHKSKTSGEITIDNSVENRSRIEPFTLGSKNSKSAQRENQTHTVSGVNMNEFWPRDTAPEDEENPFPSYPKASGNSASINQNSFVNEESIHQRYNSVSSNLSNMNDEIAGGNVLSVMESGSQQSVKKRANMQDSNGVEGTDTTSCNAAVVCASEAHFSTNSTKSGNRACGKILVLKGDNSLRWDRVKMGTGDGMMSDIKFVQHLLKNEEIRQLRMKQYNTMRKTYYNRRITPTKLFYPRTVDNTPETFSTEKRTTMTDPLEKFSATPESLDDSYGRLVIDETE